MLQKCGSVARTFTGSVAMASNSIFESMSSYQPCFIRGECRRTVDVCMGIVVLVAILLSFLHLVAGSENHRSED